MDVAIVDDWTGHFARQESGVLRLFRLLRDPLVLVVPRGHRLADLAEPVDLGRLRDEPWLAAPSGEPSRQAVDSLLAGVGGVPAAPWEFEGLATILALVARGIGIAVVPALTLAAAAAGGTATQAATGAAGGAATGAVENPIAVRELPGTLARDVYAVARAGSVRRPSVALVLTTLMSAAVAMGGTAPELPAREPPAGRREG